MSLILFVILLIVAIIFGVISFGIGIALLPVLLIVLAIGIFFFLVNLIWHGIQIIILFMIALAIYDWIKKKLIHFFIVETDEMILPVFVY